MSDCGLQRGSDIENGLSLARSHRFHSWAYAADILSVPVPSLAAQAKFNELCAFTLPKTFLDVRLQDVAVSCCHLIRFLPAVPWISIA